MNVSLREYFEQRFRALDQAQELQTKELARRLDELNHAHQKSIEDRTAFLPREVFDQYLKEVQSWRDVVNANLNQAKGRATVMASGISIAVGIIVLIVTKLWK